nr:ECF transporter S component [uncultured Oscillibacter sp.]
MEKTLRREAGRTEPRLLVLTGLFAALGCAATMVLQVPSPTGGYLNLGDAVVILGAWLLGPVYGAVAGGVGPAMADLLSGYAMYVPATLVIKALMALTAALLYRALGKKGLAVCAAAAEVPMVVGYWLFDALLTALSSGASFDLCLAGSAAGIPSNLVQAAFGAAASTLLALALRRSTYVQKRFPRF